MHFIKVIFLRNIDFIECTSGDFKRSDTRKSNYLTHVHSYSKFPSLYRYSETEDMNSQQIASLETKLRVANLGDIIEAV